MSIGLVDCFGKKCSFSVWFILVNISDSDCSSTFVFIAVFVVISSGDVAGIIVIGTRDERPNPDDDDDDPNKCMFDDADDTEEEELPLLNKELLANGNDDDADDVDDDAAAANAA